MGREVTTVSSVDAHLACFLLGGMTINAAMPTYVQSFCVFYWGETQEQNAQAR